VAEEGTSFDAGFRVSGDKKSDGQADLKAQRRPIVAACKRRGWKLVEANEVKRPGGQEPLRLLESADAATLVIAKQDTLSRLLFDLTALIASAHEQGWALVALDCAADTTTPAGEAMADLRAGFAPFERRLISQRTRQALAQKRAQGVRLGRPPTMSPYALERIRRERAAGSSLAAIANGLNADRIPTAQAGRRWYPATVRYTLKRTR
jgi:DNA invertase Pin-like site-specific DNA recombinase